MEIIYNGVKYDAYQSDNFAVEEVVCVNGITGWIDHVSYESVYVVDEQDKYHHIMFIDIDTMYVLYRNGYTDSNGVSRRIMAENWKNVKEKQLN